MMWSMIFMYRISSEKRSPSNKRPQKSQNNLISSPSNKLPPPPLSNKLPPPLSNKLPPPLISAPSNKRPPLISVRGSCEGSCGFQGKMITQYTVDARYLELPGDEEIVGDIDRFFSLGNDHGTEDFVRHSESSKYRIVDISRVNYKFILLLYYSKYVLTSESFLFI